MDAEVARGHMGSKLAFVRVGFNYFSSETVFEHIVEAIHLLANEGWKLLPLYGFDPHSGLWHHASGHAGPSVSLDDVPFNPERPWSRAAQPESVLARQLAEARRIIREVEAAPPTASLGDSTVTPEFERIRWFPLPSEALAELRA